MLEISEYNSKYDEQIKDLLVELQNYLIDIDDWHTQVMLPNYREDNFEMDIKKVNNQNGKIYLAVSDRNVVGLIMGIVLIPDEIDKLTNDCAKTGSIIELIVKSTSRNNGIRKNSIRKNGKLFQRNGL